jgi:hypothetical protein
MTRPIAIRVKTPKARIPGSHGERTLMLGIGSIHPLDQNAQPNKVIAEPYNDALKGVLFVRNGGGPLLSKSL